MTTPNGNPAAAAAAGSVRVASCIKITGNGTYEIVPYQTAVDIYADANDTLIYALSDDVESNTEYLNNASTYLKGAIAALASNISNPTTTTQTNLQTAAQTAINEIDSIINPVAPTAAPAAAPAAKTKKVMLTNIGIILIDIAKILAPPTVRLSKSGGRRKRNTRHKHRKNKNKTRVGRR